MSKNCVYRHVVGIFVTFAGIAVRIITSFNGVVKWEDNVLCL